MKTVKCKSLDEAVNNLQQYIDSRWHHRSVQKGKWLKTVPEDPYSSKDYRVELWLLEGSPAKQVVIINHYIKEICCYDVWLRKQIRFVWGGYLDFR